MGIINRSINRQLRFHRLYYLLINGVSNDNSKSVLILHHTTICPCIIIHIVSLDSCKYTPDKVKTLKMRKISFIAHLYYYYLLFTFILQSSNRYFPHLSGCTRTGSHDLLWTFTCSVEPAGQRFTSLSGKIRIILWSTNTIMNLTEASRKQNFRTNLRR